MKFQKSIVFLGTALIVFILLIFQLYFNNEIGTSSEKTFVKNSRIIDSFLIIFRNGSSIDDFVLNNISIGLEYDGVNFHSCKSKQNLEAEEERNVNEVKMKYSPNRKSLSSRNSSLFLSTVILALGGHSKKGIYDYGVYGSLNGLMSVWDSWIENYFSYTSNNTLLTMILDERDYLLQKYAKNKEEYLDTILIKNMGCEKVYCVQEQNYKNYESKKLCEDKNYLNIDQGYFVYYFDLKKLNPLSFQKPLIILASIYKFPKPKWAKKENEENLFDKWKPRKIHAANPTNYGYVKLTNWYSHHMFNLKLLDFFDFGIKLDSDVSFVSPFPISNIPKQMIDLNAKILTTSKEWLIDSDYISRGVSNCVLKFLTQETKHCKKLLNNKNEINLVPGGKNYSIFWGEKGDVTFPSYYVVFSLDFYSSPEVLNFGKYWNDFDPYGMWDFRWGDQQFWPRPIQLFGSGNLSKDIYHFDQIDSKNENYMVHKLDSKQKTLRNINYFNPNGFSKENRDDAFKNTFNKS